MAIYSKLYVKRNDDDDEKENDLFDMNNVAVLKNLGEKQRNILTKVICKAIVSVPSFEIVEICNCDVDDNFMEVLCGNLVKYYLKSKDAAISILSLQSNPIADRGMLALCKLIRVNHPSLTMIKLQNNRKDVS